MLHLASHIAALGSPMSVGGRARGRLPPPRDARVATAIGGSAVLVWSTAASFAVLGLAIPPLLFLAGAFGSAFLAFLAMRVVRGQRLLDMLIVPVPVLGLMVLGFLGHNGLYIAALRHAPAAQVNLISYLWPLMMVALIAATGTARPTRLQVLGSLLGFAGLAWFLAPETTGGSPFGLLLALCAALCFAAYSGLRAKVSGGPPDAAGAACGVAAVLAFGLHLIVGAPVSVPFEASALLAMVLIGIGPMGLANLLWDHGVRHGDGRVLATLAYLTPLLSTLLLLAFGLAVLTFQVVVGGVLILGGIALSALGAERER